MADQKKKQILSTADQKKKTMLPIEVISRILIRLPVKSLLRFLCVESQWGKEIRNPRFIKEHLSHSLDTGTNHSPIARGTEVANEGTLYFLNPNSFGKVEKEVSPISESSYLCNTCNGLLLIENIDNDELMILNSSTRESTFLPKLNPISPDPLIMECLCLGYDDIHDDYKVFVIRTSVDLHNKFVSCEADVWSLNTKRWRTVPNFTKSSKIWGNFSSYGKGVLFAVNQHDYKNIVALNVGTEDFRLLQLPPNSEINNLPSLVTCIFDGCPVCICEYRDLRFDMWVMKDYGGNESWTMLLSINLPMPYPSAAVLPLLYSQDRDKVLLSNFSYGSDNPPQLMWYDLKERTLTRLDVRGLPADANFHWVCVESLVPVGS